MSSMIKPSNNTGTKHGHGYVGMAILRQEELAG
jgi:hypothetical protein